jgi:hypothetical protein
MAGYGVYDDIQSGEPTQQAVVSQGGGLSPPPSWVAAPAPRSVRPGGHEGSGAAILQLMVEAQSGDTDLPAPDAPGAR